MNEVLRQENKYLMNMVDMWLLSGHLRRMMISDHHNVALGRQLRPRFRYVKREGDYENKLDGMELWRKFRLGLYVPQTDFAMLEMKQT